MFKYYFKSKSKKYLLATLLITVLCPLIAFSYSSFIFSSDNYRTSEMYIGSLMYSMKINNNAATKITAVPGKSEHTIEITSLNSVPSFYKLIYKTNQNILVEYNNETIDEPKGEITNKREILIRITNSSSSNIEVEFDVAAGYITNTIENVTIPNGYTEVTGVYITNDISIIAIYVDGVLTNSLDSEQNYELDNYTCTNNETVSWNNDSKALTVTPLTESTECTVYFKVKNNPTLYEKILADNNEKSDANINFSYSSNGCSGEEEVCYEGLPGNSSHVTNGLYQTNTNTENSKTVYYFRGAVDNNYVLFAGKCWRIIRTGEDDSIRLRYSGEPTNNGSCYVNGTTLKGINNNALYAYSANGGVLNNAKYTNSDIKPIVDSWYTTNIENQGTNVTNFIVDSPYCNDIMTYDKDGTTYFKGYQRLFENKNPQFKCSNSSYNISVANGGLSKPVALITADELLYAGAGYGRFETQNTEMFLYTGTWNWTMTPYDFLGYLSLFSFLESGYINSDYSDTPELMIYPVISVTQTIPLIEGTGYYDDPYVIGI